MVNQNEFGGTISASIHKMSHLEVLELGSNNFVGTLPLELGELTRLGTLMIAQTSLQGSFFNKFEGKWPALRQLILDGTRLTGTIPSTIVQWELENFSLMDVQFNGNLPTFSINPSLTQFRVSSPQISGTLPDIGLFQNLGAS